MEILKMIDGRVNSIIQRLDRKFDLLDRKFDLLQETLNRMELVLSRIDEATEWLPSPIEPGSLPKQGPKDIEL